MKHWLFVLWVLGLGSGCRAPRARAISATPHRPRGVSLGLFASEPRYDYRHLLEEIVALGAQDVMLVVPLAQPHADSAQPSRAVPVETVARTLRQARGLGLRTALLPIVELRAAPPGEWRGQLRPEEGVAVWFERYRSELVALATLAERETVLRFGVGSELVALEPYEHEWRGLIAAVRGVYHGRVFYSVNWDGLERPGFLEHLDEVGVSAYFTLGRRGEPLSTQGWVQRWGPHRAALRRLAARTGKPVFLSEVGYPSVDSAAERPWDDKTPGVIDLPLQSRLLDAVCATFFAPDSPGAGEVTGLYVWNWFGYGGPSDAGFTPRGKPAAGVLRGCFLYGC